MKNLIIIVLMSIVFNAEAQVADSTTYKVGYYQGINNHNVTGAYVGNMCTSMACSPLISMAVFLPTYFIAPKDENLKVPDLSLKNNPSYMAGYKAGAWERKKQFVYMGWSFGVITSFFASYYYLTTKK
ncbi:MAG: hypothetical protein NTX03_09355 [Bacteroidetes bacterium]|nr:hypothetical protein [Bacteroidota bacterium]